MKKGEKFDTVSGANEGKATVEEKGKRASHRTRIEMDFDSKTSKLPNQEAGGKYLASYSFHLNLGIKIEFCPQSVDVSLAPPNKDCVYMHPKILALVLGPMTKFMCGVLSFTKLPPLSYRWRPGARYKGLRPSVICMLLKHAS